MSTRRIAYVCGDAGIAPDGHKGASVHFREMGLAFGRNGVDARVVVARPPRGSVSGLEIVSGAPARRRLGGVAGELDAFVDQGAMLAALDSLPSVDAVYERYSLFSLAGLSFARARDLPFVLEVNAPLWEEARRFRDLRTVDLARAVARELFRRADLVLPVSRALREIVIGEGAPRERVKVFPNGVAPGFLADVRPHPRPEAFGDREVLLFVGSLKPWHGIEFLLETFDRGGLGEIALWVVGDGPLRDAVIARERAHPDRVRFEGALPHAGVASIVRAADAAIAPYERASPEYFCPLKVVEALVVGTPLVASTVRAVRDVVPDECDVHWFEPGDGESLARAVRAAMDARGAADNARSRAAARARFTWDARVGELVEWLGWESSADATRGAA